MDSINYYDNNVEKFINDTMSASMESLIKRFVRYIPEGSHVLDLGCGSGRDSLWLLDHGYKVLALDGSIEMVNHCSKLLGERVTHSSFENFNTNLEFDGIWACASLLHVKNEDLKEIIIKYANFLKTGGAFFMSFKVGDSDNIKDGRWFTNLNENSLRVLMDQVTNLKIIEIIKTDDVRVEKRDQGWISVIAKRI